MQNDVLKNKIAPWQENGRWYHANITSTGSSWVFNFDKSDPVFAGSAITPGNILVTPFDYNKEIITDIKVILHKTPTDIISVGYNAFYIRFSTNQNIFLCPVGSYTGEIDLWIFAADIK